MGCVRCVWHRLLWRHCTPVDSVCCGVACLRWLSIDEVSVSKHPSRFFECISGRYSVQHGPMAIRCQIMCKYMSIGLGLFITFYGVLICTTGIFVYRLYGHGACGGNTHLIPWNNTGFKDVRSFIHRISDSGARGGLYLLSELCFIPTDCRSYFNCY